MRRPGRDELLLMPIWWGEAPERPNNSAEATDDVRLKTTLRLRSRRAVIPE
jgi:hypothetical protein